MLLQIDLASSEPLYRQIRTQIVQGVASGELSAGDALPSVRSLASDLGINMHTVNKAYAVLRDEGYVVMRGRSGAYIADSARTMTPARAQERLDHIAGQLAGLATEYRARGGTEQGFVELARAQAHAVFGATGEDDAS